MTTISFRQGWPLLLLFIAGVIGIGFLVGLVAAPGNYINSLKVPDLILRPPLSTGIWVLMSVAFAAAGWRLWLLDSSALETRIWVGILILSWWYAPVFFLMRSPSLALLVITVMCLALLYFIFRAWNRDRISALLFIPYFLWVSYAAAVTAAIVAMN